jgi:hypothetical protein
MEPIRLDQVRIDVAGEIIMISWTERDVLLEELAFAADTKGLRIKFEAVGRSGLVELDADERAGLRKALDDWGSDRLQSYGIARLHAALVQAG